MNCADEDESDATTEPISSIADNDAFNTADDAFSWAFNPDDNIQTCTNSLRSSGDLQWQEGGICAPLKPFVGETGASLPLYINANQNASPLDFFHMFVPRSIFSIACKETTNYVDFYQDEKRDQGREWWEWTDSYWTPVEDEEELHKFLGICMVMSVKKLPHPQCYWSRHEDVRDKLVADAMSAERFSKLMQYFYLSNPWRDPERISNAERRAEACLRDPMYKVSNVLWPAVQESSKTMYNPNQNVVLRQLEILDKLQRRDEVQPADSIWKVLTVEDAATGYIKNAQFYQVLHGLDSSDSIFPSESEVTSVLSDMVGRQHVVFADSVFISPQTACKLVEFEFQVSANCSAWPTEFSDTNMMSLSADERLQRRYKEVAASAWKCKSTVHRRLTTFDDGESNQSQTEESLDCQERKDNVAFSQVVRQNSVIKSHDEGGYLLFNSLLLAHMSKSTWKRIFWIIIDIALNNANVLWKQSGRIPLTLSEFTMEVARGLITGDSATKHKPRARASRRAETRIPVTPAIQPRPVIMQATPLSIQGANNMDAILPLPEEFESGFVFHPSTLVQEDNVEHSLVKFPGRGRNCKQCTAEHLRTRSGRRRDTQFGCNICGINLCRATCFIKFHNQHNLKINRISITQIATLDYQPPVKRTRQSMGSDAVASISTPPQDASNDDISQ